jgi:hypothetical protein
MPTSPSDLPPNKAILLDNCTCVYCGGELDNQNRTTEHVIGRRFVPKGKLENQWNLIVGACRICNNRKSELEDDLSAITMQSDAAGAFAEDDLRLRAEAERKGRKSVSRRTGETVEESRENFKLDLPLGSLMSASVSLVAPPQPDPGRLFQLSRLHLMGFFYWMTFNPESKRGFFWPGEYVPIMQSPRGDWGNISQRAFMDAVVAWTPRVLGASADGYFKVAIRRHPTAECWSWALEWNKQYRLIGFFGNRTAADAVTGSFPPLKMFVIPQGPNEYFRVRKEVALSESEDKLFFYSGPEQELESS